MKSRTSGILTVAAAVALAGCGGGGGGGKPAPGPNAKRFSGQQRDVAQVVDDLDSAAQNNDARRICTKIFTPELAKQVAARNKGTCEEVAIKQLIAAKEQIMIKTLTVDVPQATATVREQNGNVTKLTFLQRNDRWYLDGIQ